MSAGTADAPSVHAPRVSLIPECVSNDADDAIFLAESYGLPPFEWQKTVLRGWLGRRGDGRWAASRCGLAVPRQNGKNGVLEMRELFGTVLLGEKFLHTAHEVKTARKAFARLLAFFDNERHYPELAGLVEDIRRANGQEAIYLTNGGSVEFIARSKGSGRGFTVDVIVMDEAQELSDEVLAALRPTVSAAPLANPQLIFTGTPPAENMNGEVFTRIREAGMAGEDTRLCWMDWGLDCGADLDDPANLQASNPSLGLMLDYDTIRDERADMDDEMFGRERGGIWDEFGSSSLISYARWEALTDPESYAASGTVYALDVSLDHTWAALALAGMREDGRAHVSVDNRPGGGTAWVVPRCKELGRQYGAKFILDKGGPAWSLEPDLRDAGLTVLPMTLPDVRQACGLFVDAVVEGTLRHRGQDTLNQAVKIAQPRPVGEGGPVFGRKSGDITSLNAACFAHWWAVTNAYDVLQSVH